MINDIIGGISIALNQEFGEEYTIYTDEVKQGLKEPCFFIFCINPTNRLFLGRRYFRTHQFVIQYISAVNSKKDAIHDVAEQLYSCLEWLEVGGDLIRGSQMHYDLVDGILHFFISYDLFVYKEVDSIPAMEELQQKIRPKQQKGKKKNGRKAK